MVTETLPQATLAPATPLSASDDMLELLRQWRDAGWIRALDCALAEFLSQQHPNTPPPVLLAGALASHLSGRGHLLLDLGEACRHPGAVVTMADVAATDQAPALPPTAILETLDPASWRDTLADSELVTLSGASETQRRPLVLDGQCLYLRRYWRFEADITRAVEAKLAQRRDIDDAQLATILEQLFPAGASGPQPDWQKLACALAARTQFSVITGGPGTGKTTTVVKLLALLQAMALQGEARRPLRIRLAAPTGKAAARLNESIASQVTRLPLADVPHGEQVRSAVPTEVTTLHRLLGARPNTRKFRHHRFNPLATDLVVVDEASMIDVEMIASLLDALPPHAGLVMLGDKDQLASVEAGAILGSLCAQAAEGHYRQDTADWLAKVAGAAPESEYVCDPARPLDQSIAMLRHSHRFGQDSGIGQLARAINHNQPAQVSKVLADTSLTDVHRLALTEINDTALETLVMDGVAGRGHGYAHYLETLQHERPADDAEQDVFDAWAAEVLAAHSQFQLLCALREGPAGVEELTPRIEARLVISGHLQADAANGAQWYEGRPVLVTGNDYGLRLMNGDIGIALQVPVDTNEAGAPVMGLRVAFPAGDGSGDIRWILPSRLQRVETVFAMTVHKSQGSEFTHAALILPDSPTPIATRELFYTAVTRARELFTLVETRQEVAQQVVRAQIQRASQLFLV
ncbi:exodeoxyribonuclease V subunit alpha [Halomonas sp. I5-271120]|uniref:exodeoxyribonuclease V subunit alpha n=1 Tax=Halomonas sp. I5-271120 TaxID=3061632 RepID=UPI00271503B3|nr:exodeoxyribonuclease V subunit alpha [Halomonas sp. I5-271120]